tara:strand:+ start:22423 stop:22683 length:261 start_codon:yes stop_codon:yes gene_type:complete
MVKGSATIALEDYHKLLKSTNEAKEKELRLKQIAKELQVFLTFICGREGMTEYVEEFNRQSTTCSISIENGRAKIKFNIDEEKAND